MSNQLIIRTDPLVPEFVFQAMSEVYDWGLQDLNIPDIHKETMGEGITIAVIDSGKSTHFEIQNNIAGAQNFSASEGVEDKCGHSTFVSGIIAAEKNNDGIIGVAPKAKIYFVKAIDDSGNGSPSALVQAIMWATEKKVNIISISAGMFVDFKPLHQAVQKAYENNIIIVAACGNTGTRYYDVAFPARYPEVIGVAAYDQKHETAPFSSRGVNVRFALPGVDIYSTWLDNQFAKMSGTSFSAPILSGICALILSKHRLGVDSKTPCETPKQMLEHLQKYSVKLDDPTATGFGTIDLKGMFTLDEIDTPTEIICPEPKQEIKPVIKIIPKKPKENLFQKIMRFLMPKPKNRPIRQMSIMKFNPRKRNNPSKINWRNRRRK